MRKITLTFPEELAVWLKEYKKAHYISISALVAGLLQEWRGGKNE